MFAINQENIPEVGDVKNLDRLKDLIEWSSHVLVVRSHEIAGFIILMRKT
jgi:predicted transcriptional regulator